MTTKTAKTIGSMSWIILSSFVALYNKVMLSALKINLNLDDEFDRSLIYIRSISGPNMDPCGTPHLICL